MISRPPPRPRLTWAIVRRRTLDVAVLGAVVALLGWVASRSGTALVYKWDWSALWPYVVRVDPATGRIGANVLLLAFFQTVRLAVWTLVLSTVIGTVFGAMATMRRLYPRLLSRAYVGLIRNVPPLVFVFVFYFFLSSQILPLFGIANHVRNAAAPVRLIVDLLFGDPALIENTASGILCLSLFSGAYVTEIVRAGLQSVPKGQIEAARSLGLAPLATFRLIVLPLALRRILPALANQFVVCIKDSSLISLISVPELTYIASEVAVSTRRVFEVWVAVGAVYFVLCFGCAMVFRRLERRWSAPFRR